MGSVTQSQVTASTGQVMSGQSTHTNAAGEVTGKQSMTRQPDGSTTTLDLNAAGQVVRVVNVKSDDDGNKTVTTQQAGAAGVANDQRFALLA
jgi:hypothetical protein